MPPRRKRLVARVGLKRTKSTPVWLAGRGWSYLRPDGGITPIERSAA